jgi:pyruvate ferredoxin oxidoreductase beta subunit
MKREAYKSLRTISHQDPIGPGGPLCAGCGGQLSLRLFHKALGDNVTFVNAASCSTMLATYPFTPLNSSWIYLAMACAPAGAQGVRDGFDILKAKGKLPAADDRKVVVLTGDGAAQEIGLQSTLAAIHRGLDFYYLCYDNESYGNTGFQSSPSTPYGARTSTEPISAAAPHGRLHERRDLFELWRVQKPDYLSTISAAYPLDLSEKVFRAGKFTGPKLFIALSPCPPGWEVDPEWSIDIARLAVETGIWPLREAIHGAVSHTYIPRKFAPVEDYLKRQGRFRHLFEPKRDDETIAHIQATVDAYWKAARSAQGEMHEATTTSTPTSSLPRNAGADEGWVSSR